MVLEVVDKTDELIVPIQEGEEEAEQSSITKSISNIFLNLPARTEIPWEIFSRLPPQTLFKLKCISKSLSKLPQQPSFALMHSSICRVITRCSFTGFFFREKNSSDHVGDKIVYNITYLPTEPEAGCLPDSSLKFLNQKGKEDSVELIDSCNGLVPCSNMTMAVVYTCFVCNPLTREKVDLPHPRRRSDRVYYALLADLTSNGYLQYKVVFFQTQTWRPLV